MTINYEINLFKELIEKYPNWEELSKYLESEEGGLLKIVDKNDKGLCLIRYEKGVSNMNLPHSKWFRSVVWNTVLNRPVCIAPPKASTNNFTFQTLKEISDAGIICQEYLEGFMINCFRTNNDNTLYITSRSKLDATGKFYTRKTFRELFIEAYLNSTEKNLNCDVDNINELDFPNTDNNEISVFYSFLVQHNEHRIVKIIDNNNVYSILKGKVYNDGRIYFEDSPITKYNKLNIENIVLEEKKGSYAEVAAKDIDSKDTQNDVQAWIKNQLLNKSWSFQGLVFKDNLGNRWRFRSEKYLAIKTLRGNSPSIVERFTQLYTQNLVEKYLEYYNEDVLEMTIYNLVINNIIAILYNNYVKLHITKVKNVNQINKVLLPHLYSIHGIYLSTLKQNNQKITINDIKLYLHKQPWQRLVFLIKNINSYIY